MSLRDIRYSTRVFKGRVLSAHWHPLGKVLRPPREARAWLLERGSLTQRLQNHFGPISVRVLQQQVGQALLDEGQHDAGPVHFRDVVLTGADQTPLVVAHSILSLKPRGSLSIALKRLGRQALGSMLFSRPGFVRYQREWALLDQRHSLYRMAKASSSYSCAQRFWARRAVFSPIKCAAQAVQVTEVFCMPASQ